MTMERLAMRTLFLLLLPCLFLAGCVVAPISSLLDETYLVWTNDKTPIAEAQKPAGFTVTPEQALDFVTHGVPGKTGIYIYADRECYFVAKESPLYLKTSGYARMYGVRVPGSGQSITRCR